MKRNEVMNIICKCEDDVAIYERPDGTIQVTVLDFEGFDDDWNEVMRDYDEVAIEQMEDTLAEVANKVESDFYTVYHFDGFKVVIDYTSYDI